MGLMVDRVAIAIRLCAKERGYHVDEKVVHHLAAAALEEIREPTVEMLAAIGDEKESNDYYSAADLIERGYKKMIDAALGKVDA